MIYHYLVSFTQRGVKVEAMEEEEDEAQFHIVEEAPGELELQAGAPLPSTAEEYVHVK